MLLRLSGYGRYIGKSRLGIGPRLDQRQGDLLDTGLELRVGAANRAVSLGITNLFDTRGNRFALGSPFLVGEADHITPLRPRTIRLGFERSEEHTSELQSLMRISYAVFCLKKKNTKIKEQNTTTTKIQ